MLRLTNEQETAVREAARRRGVTAEAVLADALAIGLVALDGAADRDRGATDDELDRYRPPLAVLAAERRTGITIEPRGYVPEPKAPRLFGGRRADGVRVASQIAFGPEAGPSLFVNDGERHAFVDVAMPLRWVLIDLTAEAWRLVFATVDDVVVKLRAGEQVPYTYGAEREWGYTVPAGWDG